eukprot:c31624_g1_i1 orf=84-263(+)
MDIFMSHARVSNGQLCASRFLTTPPDLREDRQQRYLDRPGYVNYAVVSLSHSSTIYDDA